MKATLFVALALVLEAGLWLPGAPACAAHAGDPYRNVDHSNDLGNDTGNSEIGSLNSAQLNENYHGPLELRAPATHPPAVTADPNGTAGHQPVAPR